MHAVTGYDNNPGNNDQIYTYYRKLGKNTNLSLSSTSSQTGCISDLAKTNREKTR